MDSAFIFLDRKCNFVINHFLSENYPGVWGSAPINRAQRKTAPSWGGCF
jgi:hypothetical protein